MTEQIKVLLVDDDERNIFALSAYLKAKKFKVETASDGKECLEKLQQLSVDVVLLDMMMPVMDGFETLKWLNENHPEIKIMALSMQDDDESVIKIIKNGSHGYLLKTCIQLI